MIDVTTVRVGWTGFLPGPSHQPVGPSIRRQSPPRRGHPATQETHPQGVQLLGRTAVNYMMTRGT